MTRQRIFILLILVFTSCRKDPRIPDAGPIAYYTFNGNHIDQSHYHNKTTNLGTSLTVDSLGTANSAYYFNDSSYIEVADRDIFDFTTNRLTITAWIKPSRVNGTYVVDKATFVNNQGQLTQGGGPFSLDIFPGRARALIYGDDNVPAILTGTTLIKQNVWQHLAVTWDGSNIKLYYNGQIEASAVFSKPIQVTNGNIYIGAYKWVFPAAGFKGSIDNVRIYERFLTTEEIQDIYGHYK